ncbi:MAG: cyclic nucleotide-binding domain-containing protein [Actinomycetota bacterium]
MAPLDLAGRAALIAKLPIFGGCSDGEIFDLASAARPIAFDAGDLLCDAGADSPECYVVAEGRAEVSIGVYVIDEIGPVQVVCERGPIENKPRRATVRAATEMVTYAISREEIQGLMERSPKAAGTMRDELLRRYG